MNSSGIKFNVIQILRFWGITITVIYFLFLIFNLFSSFLYQVSLSSRNMLASIWSISIIIWIISTNFAANGIRIRRIAEKIILSIINPAIDTNCIFISYRRNDRRDLTDRIYDTLCGEFGNHAVFTDIYSIPVGEDFKLFIQDVISHSKVVLVIIGEKWMSKNPDSNKFRIENTEDYIRFEIETAMKNNIQILPILINDTKIPDSDVLPDSLTEFTNLNVIRLRSGVDFKNDMNRIIHRLKDLLY